MRNTPRSRASAQLDAFPSSANAVARQSKHLKAVVSIRLKGDVIAKLDARAERDSEGRRYNPLTRSDVIHRAIAAYLGAS